MKKDFKILSNNFKGQLNLDLTINSGQTSQPAWLKKNRYFNELIIVKSNELDESLEIVVESPKEFRINAVKNHISEIFGLNDNLDDLYEFLLNDPKLEPTIDFCRGLRLFKAHNTFECLISSISSANNSIIRWNRSIRLMKEKWGDGYQFLSGNFYIFPTPEKILQVPEHEVEELEICGGEKNLEECVNNLKSCGV